jgi:hypothetical protein
VYMVAWVTPDEAAEAGPVKDASGLTLYQNYPNPVSSAHSRTNIRFEITQAGYTTLEMYDMVGRKVAVVADEYFVPGTYTRTFSVSNLPAGNYSYRLSSAGKVLSHSLIILK